MDKSSLPPSSLSNADSDQIRQATQAYFNSTDAVSFYDHEPWYSSLLLGEESVLATYFPTGMKETLILDLGCGTGRTTHVLHERGAEVIGVDLSPHLIAAAQRRAPHLDLRVGDAAALDFSADSFDAVLFSFNGLDHLPSRELRMRGLQEVWRVLRRNGLFIFSHHNLAALFIGWHKFMRPYKLRFRARHILRGEVFQRECYLSDPVVEDLRIYHAWPRQVIHDLQAQGFTLLSIHSNSRVLTFIQRYVGSHIFTRCADPWPYYVFRKQ